MWQTVNNRGNWEQIFFIVCKCMIIVHVGYVSSNALSACTPRESSKSSLSECCETQVAGLSRTYMHQNSLWVWPNSLSRPILCPVSRRPWYVPVLGWPTYAQLSSRNRARYQSVQNGKRSRSFDLAACDMLHACMPFYDTSIPFSSLTTRTHIYTH